MRMFPNNGGSGKSAFCQPHSLSIERSRVVSAVASTNNPTRASVCGVPGASFSPVTKPAFSRPSLRTTDDRTDPTFSASPSISLVPSAVCTKASMCACWSASATTRSDCPSRRPCRRRTASKRACKVLKSQTKAGLEGFPSPACQPRCCQMYMSRIMTVFGSVYDPNIAFIRLIYQPNPF